MIDAQELSKIVFDARYLLLTSKERKSTFDEYCRERIADEKREKRLQLDQVRENFRKLLIEAKVHSRFVRIACVHVTLFILKTITFNCAH